MALVPAINHTRSKKNMHTQKLNPSLPGRNPCMSYPLQHREQTGLIMFLANLQPRAQ